MIGLEYDEDGNWLETPILMEAVGMPEIPEYAPEEESAYQQLFASLEDLLYLHAALRQERGVNQSYALEAHRLMPELAKRYPVGYYTKQLSSTNYRVTLEGIAQQAWSYLKMLWQKIVTQIRRFFGWLMDVAASTSPSAEKPTEAIADIKKSAKMVVEARRATYLSEMQVLNFRLAANAFQYVDVHGNKHYFKSYRDAALTILSDPRYKRYEAVYKHTDPLYQDMAVDGPWSTYCFAVGQSAPQYYQVLVAKIQALQEAARLIKRQAPASEVFAVLSEIEHGGKKVPTIDILGLHAMGDVAHKLQALETATRLHEGDITDDYTLLAQKSLTLTDDARYIRLQDDLITATTDLGHIAELAEDMEKLIGDLPDVLNHTEVSGAFTKSMFLIHQEITSSIVVLAKVRLFYTSIARYTSEMSKAVTVVTTALHSQLTQHGNGTRDTEVVAALTKIYAHLPKS